MLWDMTSTTPQRLGIFSDRRGTPDNTCKSGLVGYETTKINIKSKGGNESKIGPLFRRSASSESYAVVRHGSPDEDRALREHGANSLDRHRARTIRGKARQEDPSQLQAAREKTTGFP